MITTTFALTALLMGLAGGPHCIAMCGAACAGLGQAADERRAAALGWFQLGRVLGYATLGALAGASMQGLGWLTTQTAALRPVWTMFHAAVLLLGVLLMVQARQPQWLQVGAGKLWRRVRALSTRWGRGGPVLIGALWALMPCGLLYSALLMAALSGGWVQGASAMMLFALGSGAVLALAPWLLLRLRALGDGAWGMRLAGLALALTSAWALWMGLVHNQAPWCLPT